MNFFSKLLNGGKKAVADVASRAIDQVNPLDNGRTWQQRQPVQQDVNQLQQPYKGAYQDSQNFSDVTANQYLKPKSVPTPQAANLLKTYYMDDLNRQPTPNELNHDVNQYNSGKSLADIQIDSVAAADEGLGFKQTPQQRQDTLKFLYDSKNATDSLSHNIFGKNPSLGQFQSVGELVENGVPQDQIMRGFAPVRPQSSLEQIRNSSLGKLLRF